MNPTLGAHVLRFGVFELDTHSGELRRHGLKVRLPEQSFQILRTLLMRPGDVVTREELRQVLWPAETFVDFEVGLNSAVRKLREALDDSADNPRFIETLPRRGYRFVAPAISPPDVATPTPAAQTPSSTVQELVPGSDVADARATLPAPTRAGRHNGKALLFVLLVGMAAFASFSGLYPRRDTATVAEPIESIVVLPFENLTGDPTQDYFADSVTDAVTAHLAQIEGIEVISRTSARQYKQTLEPLPQIRTELNGVEAVVEGTLQRFGDTVQVTAKLVRAETDRTLLARIYDGNVSRMFTLHQEIASDLADAAGWPRPATSRAQSVNPKAYEAYLKGLSAKGLQRHEGFRRAVGYLEEAIAIQPDFGAAHRAGAGAGAVPVRRSVFPTSGHSQGGSGGAEGAAAR